MSMTNAQAALIAAAFADRTGDTDNVTFLATEYRRYLDRQDAIFGNQPTSPTGQAPQLSATRCPRKSPSGFSFCDLPEGHGGKCENSHEGIAWGGTGL